jgi:hypothetical protein
MVNFERFLRQARVGKWLFYYTAVQLVVGAVLMFHVGFTDQDQL